MREYTREEERELIRVSLQIMSSKLQEEISANYDLAETIQYKDDRIKELTKIEREYSIYNYALWILAVLSFIAGYMLRST